MPSGLPGNSAGPAESESNPGSNLRAVHDSVEKEPIVLVVNAECPVTNFREDRSGKVDANGGLDLPHQVGANSEPSNFATHSRVKCLVKIVAGAQSDIGIEPEIISRDAAVELSVEHR